MLKKKKKKNSETPVLNSRFYGRKGEEKIVVVSLYRRGGSIKGNWLVGKRITTDSRKELIARV